MINAIRFSSQQEQQLQLPEKEMLLSNDIQLYNSAQMMAGYKIQAYSSQAENGQIKCKPEELLAALQTYTIARDRFDSTCASIPNLSEIYFPKGHIGFQV